MTALWKGMLDQLTTGLTGEARRLLRDLGQHHDRIAPAGLARFKAGSRAPCAPVTPRFLLRLRASKICWRHDGVLAKLQGAVLEADGLPIAVVRLSTLKPHRKGGGFAGSKKLRLHFDHASAVKIRNQVEVILSKSSAAPPLEVASPR